MKDDADEKDYIFKFFEIIANDSQGSKLGVISHKDLNFIQEHFLI